MGTAAATNLGEFLEAHPEFAFDLEEHLISTHYVDALRSRQDAFFDARRSGGGACSEPAIADWLRSNALRFVPGYPDLRQVERFADIPFLTKSRLRADPDGFVSSAVPPHRIWQKTTTGSSGTPIKVFYGEDFYFDVLLFALYRGIAGAGIDVPGPDRVFCIAVSDNRSMPDSVTVDPTGRLGLSLVVVVDPSNPKSFDRVFSLVRELSPVCVSSKPSLFEAMASLDGCAATAVRAIVSGGAHLTPRVRRIAEQAFGATAVDVYGMTELGLIASECPAGRLHVDVSTQVVEVIDEDGTPQPPGTMGELVVTSVANPAMPLLRYRTGDSGALATGRCACGALSPRIEPLSARLITCFRLTDGNLFSPTHFNDLFSRFPALEEFQLTQHAVGHYELVAQVREPAGAVHVLEDLRRYVAGAIPGSPALDARLATFAPDCKFQRYRTCL